MRFNTSYKAFLAQAAKSIYAEMVGKAIEAGKISPFVGTSFNENKEEYEHIAYQATYAAETLAKALEDNWHAQDRQTVFFDVDDTPLTRTEDAISDVAEKIEAIAEALKK